MMKEDEVPLEHGLLIDMYAAFALHCLMQKPSKQSSKDIAYAAYEQAARMMEARIDFVRQSQ